MTRTGADGPLLNCSFCGKDQSEVRRLIAGPELVPAISSGGARTLNILSHHARKRQLRERPLLVTQ